MFGCYKIFGAPFFFRQARRRENASSEKHNYNETVPRPIILCEDKSKEEQTNLLTLSRATLFESTIFISIITRVLIRELKRMPRTIHD